MAHDSRWTTVTCDDLTLSTSPLYHRLIRIVVSRKFFLSLATFTAMDLILFSRSLLGLHLIRGTTPS